MARILIDPTFSEDLPSGAALEGLRFIDPLARGFDLNQWA
jgi:hypothetical protein